MLRTAEIARTFTIAEKKMQQAQNQETIFTYTPTV